MLIKILINIIQSHFLFVLLGENDVEVAEALVPWLQNKQKIKYQENKEATSETNNR